MRCTLSGFSNFLQPFNNHSLRFHNYSNGSSTNHQRLGNDSDSLVVKSVWEEQFAYLLVGNLFTGIFLILSNSMVINGLLKTCTEIKSPQKLFIMSSVCGLVIGIVGPCIFLEPLFAIDSCIIENILGTIYSVTMTCESEFMVTLFITRLISVKWPFFEIEWQTVRVIIITEIALAVPFPIAVLSLSVESFIGWILQGVISMLWLILMLILTFLTVYFILERPSNFVRVNVTSRNDYHRIWKPIIRIATIQIAYLLCHLPMVVFSVNLMLASPSTVDQTISPDENVRNEIITIWMYLFVEFYYGLNACLYMVQSVDIRRYYHRLLTCRVGRVQPISDPPQRAVVNERNGERK